MSNAEDPHCPECGEPIGQQATYCMHCSADLTDDLQSADTDQDGAWDQSEQSSADDGGFGGWDQGDDSSTESSGFADSWNSGGGESQPAGQQSSGSQAGGQQAPGGGRESFADDNPDDIGEATGFSASASGTSEPLLDPDGIVDNSLTVIVGVLGGIVVGLVGTLTLLFATESFWAIPVGFFIWIGSTAYLVRTRTVQGAVAKSGYGVALVLLLVPVVSAVTLAVNGDFSGIPEALLIGLIFAGIPAGIAAFVGWIASRFVPDENETF